MEIIDTIRKHPLYKEHYGKLQELEKGRVFCHHDMAHFLDVARIAHIHNLERDLKIRKEVIYAAALLHDIGIDRQYTEKIPHERASAEIAEQILNDVATGTAPAEIAGSEQERRRETFSGEERDEILQAILGHRKRRGGMGALEELLYVSDKQSRSCFACAAKEGCDWSEEEKNDRIKS